MYGIVLVCAFLNWFYPSSIINFDFISLFTFRVGIDIRLKSGLGIYQLKEMHMLERGLSQLCWIQLWIQSRYFSLHIYIYIFPIICMLFIFIFYYMYAFYHNRNFITEFYIFSWSNFTASVISLQLSLEI